MTRTRPKRADLPKATFDLIVEKNSFDVALYRFAAGLFEEAVNKQPAEVSRIAQELQTTHQRTQGSFKATLFSFRAATRKAINRAYSTI